MVRGAERRDRLAALARGEPRPLERRDNAAHHRVADSEREADLAEIVPDADAHPVMETAGARIVGMHLEGRWAVPDVEPAERGRDAAVRRRGGQGQRGGRLPGPPAPQPRARFSLPGRRPELPPFPW